MRKTELKKMRTAVMILAHALKKEDSRNVWSECLKYAWKTVKANFERNKEEYYGNGSYCGIKEWFVRKNWTQNERYVLQTADSISVVKETEKAVDLKIVGKYGTMFKWVPKSCLA